MTRALFLDSVLRFAGDSGLDNRRIFRWMDLVEAKFVIRAQQNRRIEVYNDRLDRWEEELLDDLVAAVYLPLTLRGTFTHARQRRVWT